jgi:hypothetical protein
VRKSRRIEDAQSRCIKQALTLQAAKKDRGSLPFSFYSIRRFSHGLKAPAVCHPPRFGRRHGWFQMQTRLVFESWRCF